MHVSEPLKKHRLMSAKWHSKNAHCNNVLSLLNLRPLLHGFIQDLLRGSLQEEALVPIGPHFIHNGGKNPKPCKDLLTDAGVLVVDAVTQRLPNACIGLLLL